MIQHIIVPLDGSRFAEHALPHAIGLAVPSGARLQLVTVHGLPTSPPSPEQTESDVLGLQMAEAEESYLERVAARIAETTGLTTEHTLLADYTVHGLADFVDEQSADLVVMSTHGRGGLERAWLGSVADGIVRRVHAPVLLIRPTDETAPIEQAAFRRVLVGVDGSATAEAALRLAAEVCALHRSACHVLRVVVPPGAVASAYLPETVRMNEEAVAEGRAEADAYLQRLRSSIDALPANAQTEPIVHYRPAEAILERADELGADLIVVGSRGSGRVARMLLGSVADKVIRGAKTPVLVVTSAAAAEHPGRAAEEESVAESRAS